MACALPPDHVALADLFELQFVYQLLNEGVRYAPRDASAPALLYGILPLSPCQRLALMMGHLTSVKNSVNHAQFVEQYREDVNLVPLYRTVSRTTMAQQLLGHDHWYAFVTLKDTFIRQVFYTLLTLHGMKHLGYRMDVCIDRLQTYLDRQFQKGVSDTQILQQGYSQFLVKDLLCDPK